MDPRRFMLFRVAFSGLPFGELEAACRRMDAGAEWAPAFERSARELGLLAARATREGRRGSAAQAWRWAASGFHAASLGLHLLGPGLPWRRPTLRLRRLAQGAYRRALRLDASMGQWVRVPTPRGDVGGYLRLPPRGPAPLVVVFNGLDSLCEVELHSFGDALLSRGLGVFAADLPAAFGMRPRAPVYAAEEVAPALADWAARQPGVLRGRLGAFGVSFGGHLVARALAGDPRFVAGVAVSPNATLDGPLIALERMRRMVALAFDLPEGAAVDALASAIRLEGLEPPEGALLVMHMEEDRLFGPEHAVAFLAWGGERVEMRSWQAEHVGTSRVHDWLPLAADWLHERIHAEANTKLPGVDSWVATS